MEKRRINYWLLAIVAIIAAAIVAERTARATEEELLEIGYARFAKTLAEHGYPAVFNRQECSIALPENEPDVSSYFLCRAEVQDGIFHYAIAFDLYGGFIYSQNEIGTND